MFLHGYDNSSLLSHLDAKCLPTKYGGLMEIDTDQGIELWKLLCKYEKNYRGMNLNVTQYMYDRHFLTMFFYQLRVGLCF